MAGRSGTTGTGSRVPRPGSQCSTRSEGTQSLWKHNQFLARGEEKGNMHRCDTWSLLGCLVRSRSCCYCSSCCVVDLYPTLPHCSWKVNSHIWVLPLSLTCPGTQGWASGYGLLRLKGERCGESTQFYSNPAISGCITRKLKHHTSFIWELHKITSRVPAWVTPPSAHRPAMQLPQRQAGHALLHHSLLSTGPALHMYKKGQLLNELKRKIPELLKWKVLFLPQFHLCKGSTIFVAVMVN